MNLRVLKALEAIFSMWGFQENSSIIVMEIKIKLSSFKSSEHIYEKGGGPYRGFGYSSLFSDPLDLATWRQRALPQFCNFQQGSRYKD